MSKKEFQLLDDITSISVNHWVRAVNIHIPSMGTSLAEEPWFDNFIITHQGHKGNLPTMNPKMFYKIEGDAEKMRNSLPCFCELTVLRTGTDKFTMWGVQENQ